MMIELKNISRIFCTEDIETTALNNINCTIQASEFVAIMGPLAVENLRCYLF